MKTKYYILSLCTAAAAFFSCTDASSLLDREDVGTLYESDVFRNPAYARYFVNDIYYHLPGADWTPGTGYQPKSTWYGAYLECATDNAEARRLDSDAQHFNEGNWNAESMPLGDVWANDYAQIRACNKFLENYESITPISGVASAEEIKYLRGQVIFLRALFYADLAKHFGGVPVVEKVLHFDSPELQSSRWKFADLVDYIVSQCDEAAAIFREVEGAITEDTFGRANEGVAMSLKAQVLTMAASPLFNRPAGYPQYDSGDPNVALWRYPDYDPERWRRAADALGAVIQSGKYSLWTSKSGTKTAYETYFVTRDTRQESIFSSLKGPDITLYYSCLPFDFMLINGKGSPVCYNLPTYDLVASYEMANGMLPEQEGSGYRPLHPFSGRDPRLEATVWHDGSTFCGIEFQTWRRETTSQKQNGKDYITGYSRTGFFMKKFLDVDLNPNNKVTLPNSMPIIRYADILLMYAEAVNEMENGGPNGAVDGVSLTAVQAVNLVRDRAGMPDVAETFANRGWALDRDNLRKLIYNERRVEFAFENQRFWDVRRCMIGPETQRAVHELDIVLKDDDKTRIYTVKQMEKRSFENYMNLMPIPQSEINKNRNLVQNWGWAPASLN